MVQLPRSWKQPDTLGVDTHGSVVVVLLVEVLVELLVLLELVVRVVGLVVEVVWVVSVVEVVGTMSGSGSPQWASEQLVVSPSPTSSATRHVLDGSAQWENGNTAMSQSVGISHRGSRGSTQIHPEKNSNPLA
jgi:hypothetical protein